MKITFGKSGGTVSINGSEFAGNSVSIENGKVRIDGDLVSTPDFIEDKIYEVTINGHVEKLELNSGRIKANDITTLSTVSGSVECNDVLGSVSSVSGKIEAKTIHGDAKSVSGKIIR